MTCGLVNKNSFGERERGGGERETERGRERGGGGKEIERGRERERESEC